MCRALDALDPLFIKLSDAYMKALIAEFGTDHYYQADGFFNAAKGPWLAEEESEAVALEQLAETGAGQPPIDAVAAAHSAAAYGGMARTDPQATWVYQTWIWRGFKGDKIPYLKGWLSSIPCADSCHPCTLHEECSHERALSLSLSLSLSLMRVCLIVNAGRGKA